VKELYASSTLPGVSARVASVPRSTQQDV